MMNSKLFQMAPDLFRQEIYKPQMVLSNHLDHPIMIFVYPYGKVIPEGEAWVSQNYLLAFGLGEKSLILPLGPTTDLKNLPRFMFDVTNYQKLTDQIIEEAK